MGCFLCQKQQKQLEVINNSSRVLVGAEKRYHNSQLEYLALKRAVCNHFKPYLNCSKRCDVFTDNSPLLYAMSKEELNPTGQRWASELCNYPISIHYKQCIQDKVVDCLRRSPIRATVQHQALSTGEIKAILSPVKSQDDHEHVWIVVLIVTKQPETDSKKFPVTSVWAASPKIRHRSSNMRVQ